MEATDLDALVQLIDRGLVRALDLPDLALLLAAEDVETDKVSSPAPHGAHPSHTRRREHHGTSATHTRRLPR